MNILQFKSSSCFKNVITGLCNFSSSNLGSMDRTSSVLEQDRVEFVVQKSELKRKRSIVSPSDLTIHETHPDNTVIKKWLSSENPEDDNKNSGNNGDHVVLGFVTSSSLNNLPLTNVDKNDLPPEYYVSKKYQSIILFSFR